MTHLDVAGTRGEGGVYHDQAASGQGKRRQEKEDGTSEITGILICDALWRLLRPALLFACYCVGKVYLEGRKWIDLPLSRPARTAASGFRGTKGEGDTI
jgi:hypothetical protein